MLDRRDTVTCAAEEGHKKVARHQESGREMVGFELVAIARDKAGVRLVNVAVAKYRIDMSRQESSGQVRVRR